MFIFASRFQTEPVRQIYEIIDFMARVLVEHGEIVKLAQLLGVARKTIREALSGQTNTPLACKIRKLALDRGGVFKPTQNPTQL